MRVLDTHLHGQPRPLRGHPVQQAAPGETRPWHGARYGDNTAGRVCIYLQHRVRVGACVRVFSEPAPAVLWPTGPSAPDVTVLRINVSAD